jgi:chromosome segregation ATPase
MAIASVVQGLIETEDGRVFELDSCKGSAWLESIGSFRYEPTGANKPYTVRQETKKGGDYWYGYRKVAGKLHKKYIGKSSELSTAKLEEIAEALNTSQQPRVTQVADTVTQVIKANNQQVTDTVTDSHTAERVTALELQMQALRESLEALRSELLGKPEGLGNFSELPNPYEVTDSELQIELGNLKTELSNLATENEKLRADYDALLESSTVVTNKLGQELAEVRSQLEAEKTRGEEIWEELSDTEQALAEVRSENSELKKTCAELRSQLEQERADREEVEAELAELAQLKKEAKEHAHELHREENSMKLEKVRWQRELSDARAELADAKATILNQGNKIRELERGYSLKPNPAESRLRLEIGNLQSELSELKQKSATASKGLPEAADLLNQLKAKRKKSKADLADLEFILEILES